MKNNNILINDLQLLDAGYDLCCEVAASTYGAEGKLCLLEMAEGKYFITKDGFNSMRHVKPSNKIMAFGAQHALAGAGITVMKSGDGSTTAAILMQSFLRKLDRSKFNKKVEKGILKGIEEVYDHLNRLAVPATKEDVKKIARVSLNHDYELADTVIEAFDHAGEDGFVECVVKPGRDKTVFVPQNGLIAEGHGYMSEYFINKESGKICFEGENVAVLTAALWNYDHYVISQIQSFYSDGDRKKPLVVFLEKPNPEMLEKLIAIKLTGFNICAVACNEYSEIESENLLKDIANFCGAVTYNPRNPDSKAVFGLAEKIVVTLDSTVISVDSVPQSHKDTLEQLKSIEKRDEKRIKRLTTKSAIIEIGDISETGLLEQKDRLDDCLGAIKTTLQEGTVAGGGSSLVYISGQMKTEFENKEIQIGYDLVKEVLTQPMLRLLKNSNRESIPDDSELKTETSIDYLKPAFENYGYGYNVSTDEIENLIDSGIIDSKKSVRISIESAVERSIQMFNISVIAVFPTNMELKETSC